MSDSRVVVTGLGVVTPIGIGLPDFWKNLLAGTNGVARLTAFDTTGFPSTMAAEVRGFDPGPWIDPKSAARMDRFSQFAVAAADLAMADSGLAAPASTANGPASSSARASAARRPSRAAMPG